MSGLWTCIALKLDVLTKYACGWLYGEAMIVSERLKLHWLAAKKANTTVSKDIVSTERCINATIEIIESVK